MTSFYVNHLFEDFTSKQSHSGALASRTSAYETGLGHDSVYNKHQSDVMGYKRKEKEAHKEDRTG